MGYGGSASEAGRALGKSGVDGVIDQDALGLDRIYVQAKRYPNDDQINAYWMALRETPKLTIAP